MKLFSIYVLDVVNGIQTDRIHHQARALGRLEPRLEHLINRRAISDPIRQHKQALTLDRRPNPIKDQAGRLLLRKHRLKARDGRLLH